MPNAVFGPFTKGLDDAQAPHLIGSQSAQLAINVRLDRGNVEPLYAPTTDPNIGKIATDSSYPTFLHRITSPLARPLTGTGDGQFNAVLSGDAASNLSAGAKYAYCATYVNSLGQESEPGPVVVITQPTPAKQVTISVPAPPTGTFDIAYPITARKLYRRKLDGSADDAWLLISGGTITGSTASTFTDDFTAGPGMLTFNWVRLTSLQTENVAGTSVPPEVRVFGCEEAGRLYYVSPYTGAKKTMGGSATLPLGVAPGPAVTAAQAASGSLTGTFKYVAVMEMVYENGTTEYQLSPVSDPITVSNTASISVTIGNTLGTWDLRSGQSSESTVKLYRTANDSDYYLVRTWLNRPADPANNQPSCPYTYIDNALTANLGSVQTLPAAPGGVTADPKPTCAITTTGQLTGTFTYILTVVDPWGDESAGSAASSPVTVSNVSQIDVTIPDALPYRIWETPGTTLKLYRISTTGGQATGEYQLVTTIDSNTLSGEGKLPYVYNDVTPTDQLGTTTYTSATYVVPPKLTGLGGPFAGCLWGWHGSLLYFSVEGYYHGWNPLSFLQFPDPIQQIMPWGGDLLVLCASSEWLVVGQSAGFSQIRLPSAMGCISPNSVVKTEHGVIWLSRQGFVAYNSGTPRLISGGKLAASRFYNLAAPLATSTAPSDPVTTAAYHRGYYYLSRAYNTDFTTNNGLIADLRGFPEIAWTEWQHATDIPAVLATDNTTGLLYGLYAKSGTYLKRFDLDAPAPAMTYWTGEWIGSTEAETYYKHFRNVRLDFTLPTNTTTYTDLAGSTVTQGPGTTGATCKVYVDGVLKHTFTLAASREAYRLPPGLRGRWISLKFEGLLVLKQATVEYDPVERIAP